MNSKQNISTSKNSNNKSKSNNSNSNKKKKSKEKSNNENSDEEVSSKYSIEEFIEENVFKNKILFSNMNSCSSNDTTKIETSKEIYSILLKLLDLIKNSITKVEDMTKITELLVILETHYNINNPTSSDYISSIFIIKLDIIICILRIFLSQIIKPFFNLDNGREDIYQIMINFNFIFKEIKDNTISIYNMHNDYSSFFNKNDFVNLQYIIDQIKRSCSIIIEEINLLNKGCNKKIHESNSLNTTFNKQYQLFIEFLSDFKNKLNSSKDINKEIKEINNNDFYVDESLKNKEYSSNDYFNTDYDNNNKKYDTKTTVKDNIIDTEIEFQKVDLNQLVNNINNNKNNPNNLESNKSDCHVNVKKKILVFKNKSKTNNKDNKDNKEIKDTNNSNISSNINANNNINKSLQLNSEKINSTITTELNSMIEKNLYKDNDNKISPEDFEITILDKLKPQTNKELNPNSFNNTNDVEVEKKKEIASKFTLWLTNFKEYALSRSKYFEIYSKNNKNLNNSNDFPDNMFLHYTDLIEKYYNNSKNILYNNNIKRTLLIESTGIEKLQIIGSFEYETYNKSPIIIDILNNCSDEKNDGYNLSQYLKDNSERSNESSTTNKVFKNKIEYNKEDNIYKIHIISKDISNLFFFFKIHNKIDIGYHAFRVQHGILKEIFLHNSDLVKSLTFIKEIISIFNKSYSSHQILIYPNTLFINFLDYEYSIFDKEKKIIIEQQSSSETDSTLYYYNINKNSVLFKKSNGSNQNKISSGYILIEFWRYLLSFLCTIKFEIEIKNNANGSFPKYYKETLIPIFGVYSNNNENKDNYNKNTVMSYNYLFSISELVEKVLNVKKSVKVSVKNTINNLFSLVFKSMNVLVENYLKMLDLEEFINYTEYFNIKSSVNI